MDWGFRESILQKYFLSLILKDITQPGRKLVSISHAKGRGCSVADR